MLACLSGERGDRKEGKPGSERDDRAIHGCALDRLLRTVGRCGSRIFDFGSFALASFEKLLTRDWGQALRKAWWGRETRNDLYKTA